MEYGKGIISYNLLIIYTAYILIISSKLNIDMMISWHEQRVLLVIVVMARACLCLFPIKRCVMLLYNLAENPCNQIALI